MFERTGQLSLCWTTRQLGAETGRKTGFLPGFTENHSKVSDLYCARLHHNIFWYEQYFKQCNMCNMLIMQRPSACVQLPRSLLLVWYLQKPIVASSSKNWIMKRNFRNFETYIVESNEHKFLQKEKLFVLSSTQFGLHFQIILFSKMLHLTKGWKLKKAHI